MGRFTIAQHPDSHKELGKEDKTSLYVVIGIIVLILLVLLIKLRNYLLG